MAKADPVPPTPPTPADPDEEFFKTHGVETDEDKQYLKGAHLREEYLEHRRKIKADADKAAKDGGKKKGLFGKRD